MLKSINIFHSDGGRTGRLASQEEQAVSIKWTVYLSASRFLELRTQTLSSLSPRASPSGKSTLIWILNETSQNICNARVSFYVFIYLFAIDLSLIHNSHLKQGVFVCRVCGFNCGNQQMTDDTQFPPIIGSVKTQSPIKI